jgi:Protein of unknown function (DUF1353)
MAKSKSLRLALLLSFLFPQFAAAQQPIAPVPMTPFGDGQDSVLTQDLQYRVLQTTFVIVVPAGFVTDFASTPRALWSVIPPTGRYQLAAVVHDFLYWDQGCTREQADAVFRVAMAESNVKPFERDLMWQAVRNFGQSAWNENAAAKQAGKPRIIPTAYMNIPPLVTWPEYQTQLITQGVTPMPTPPTAPTYCTAGLSATLPSP